MKSRSLFFLAFLALPFFVALEDSSLWDANEAFYAQTPREMIESGDWIVPHFNGRPRLNKPPLSYWIVATCYRFFSVSVFWERFPMAVLAYASVLALFWIGRILFEESVALWAAGIFATTFRFLILARRLFIDVLLVFCILVAVAFFLSWLKEAKPSRFLLSALFFGLAFLTKGPVALLPVLALGLYLILSGRASALSRAPWLAGSAVFLVVSSSWFLLLAHHTGWQSVGDFFFVENIGRYTFLEMGPQRGPLYYPGVFLGDFFPWSLFFVAALIWGAAKGRFQSGSLLFLLCWTGVYFLFFSFSLNKQEHYLLPLYPAAALWVSAYLGQARPARLLLGLTSCLILILAIVLYLISNIIFSSTSFVWIPPLLLAVVAGVLFYGRLAWTIAGLAIFYSAGLILYLKPYEEYKPVVHFAETLRDRRGDVESWRAGYYKLATPSLAFYLDRPILELFESDQAAEQLRSEETLYLIVRAEDYRELVRATGKPLQIVDVRPRLYTTARTIIEEFRHSAKDTARAGFRGAWRRPVYLITNRPTGSVRGHSGLQ